jgi:hypothetical protein
MANLRWWLAGGLALLAAAGGRAGPADGPEALAARIDRHLAAGWAKAGVTPAPVADDAEFVRRVYLDLAGRVPSVAEARQFLDDRRPDKRARLVEKLLGGPRYVTHFVNVWRSLLLPEATSSFQTRFLVPGFEAWLRKQLARNAPYDAMVRDLLTAPVGQQSMQNIYGQGGQGEPTPIAFYLAKEVKPENLAAATSRVFLGFKLECAQCHNHPFADWKRDQFWGYAAFFAGLQAQRQGDFAQPGREIPDRREVKIPGTDKVVQASFPDGKAPAWKAKANTRQTLAEWMTARDNPYFARAAANRLWAYFLGTGLIDPVDEMFGSEHSASHPELLDELARELAAHDFDLKFLIRAITASKAYQLTSAGKGEVEAQHFARMPLRGLSPEQLYDSVATATGYRENSPGLPPGVVVKFGNNGSARDEFLTRFANQSEKATEVQTSILQALSLMNGRLVASATDLKNSETLAGVLDSPFMDTRARVEALYLAALSRKPKPKELDRLVRFVEAGGAAADEAAPETDAGKEARYNSALADVFWALLNSGEFFLNH